MIDVVKQGGVMLGGVLEVVIQRKGSQVDASTQQQWVDYLAGVAFDGCTRKQYFDLGQEIIVSSMLSGSAWLPLPGNDNSSAPRWAAHDQQQQLQCGVNSTSETDAVVSDMSTPDRLA